MNIEKVETSVTISLTHTEVQNIANALNKISDENLDVDWIKKIYDEFQNLLKKMDEATL